MTAHGFIEVTIVKHEVVSDTFAPSTSKRTLEVWAKTHTTREPMS
jgi:hypothetical protein